MPKTEQIADCLRRYAWWCLDRADEPECGRNARSAVALLDAAAYVATLADDAPIVTRLTAAGRFERDEFHLGEAADRLVRSWHHDERDGGAADLLNAIAAEIEPLQVPAQRRPNPPPND